MLNELRTYLKVNNMEQNFYVCNICKTKVAVLNGTGERLVCCNQPMEKLTTNNGDEMTLKKHIPVVSLTNNNLHVTIGNPQHPMSNDHYIEWIYVKLKDGGMRKIIGRDEAPVADFCLCDDDVLEKVYCYCNVHGLFEVDASHLRNKI